MPNHITNEVSAPEHVIQAILNEAGEIDFEKLLPRPAIYERFGEGVSYIDQELMALGVYAQEKTNYKVTFARNIIGEKCIDSLKKENGEPLQEHEVRELVRAAEPFIARILARDRGNSNEVKVHVDALVLQALCLSQTGFPDPISWSYANWGTKWNGYDFSEVEPTLIRFSTAWSCPTPVLVELSKKFPDDEISVQYADEDIGSNCGYFTLKDGEMITYASDDDNDFETNWEDFASQLVYGVSYEELMQDEDD